VPVAITPACSASGLTFSSTSEITTRLPVLSCNAVYKAPAGMTHPFFPCFFAVALSRGMHATGSSLVMSSRLPVRRVALWLQWWPTL
jgi:hypothetical protein